MVGGTPPPASVLTKYYGILFVNAASYKQTKYSDFAKMKFFFRFSEKAVYKNIQILPGINDL
jgi:hypothetical protein